jgi:hypothetical protein
VNSNVRGLSMVLMSSHATLPALAKAFTTLTQCTTRDIELAIRTRQ